MDILNRAMSEEALYYWETFIQDWGMVVAVGILIIEMIVLAATKRFTLRVLGDAFANFGTLVMYWLVLHI